MVFWVMEKETELAKVTADYKTGTVHVENYTEDTIFRPFGIRESGLTIDDLEYFMETRCFPRGRANAKQLLSDLGLNSYDPIGIVTKTHGKLWDDFCWIKFEGEDLDYERDIKLRD